MATLKTNCCILSKESCSYISGNGNPEKNPCISENGTFLYFGKGIFRAITYLAPQVYSELWYILSPRHIQSTVKHLRWNLLGLILRNFSSLWAVSKVEGLARAPRLPGFILLGGFTVGLTISRLWKGLRVVSKVENSARVPCFSRFILLGSFSDTLLVVSSLDITN